MLRKYALMALLCQMSASFAQNAIDCRPENLKCEYMINPIGIDSKNPRLTWQIKDARQGALQQAYELYVGTDSAEVIKGTGKIWSTGKTDSDQILVQYKGEVLKPFTKYFWNVAIWDKDGKKTSSPVANFETGMMEMKNWKGSWITDENDMHVKPAPYYRKTFSAKKKIRSARAYIAAGGLFELYINGKRIGNQRLDPMYTRFDRRTLYVTHDVTSAIQGGDNAIGVILGNGWYNHQSTAVWYFDKAPWRARPKFCLDLRITFEDGTVETIVSETDWKTALGPIIFNSIYTGEHYDARLEQTNWSTTNFDASAWKATFPTAAPSQNIVAQILQPIRNVEEIPAISVKKTDSKKYLFDLGRNISGASKFTVKAEAGTTFRLKHAERLDNGKIDQSNIDVHYRPTDDKDPFQTDIFITSGKGEETFMPRFNYKGFQYVEVISDKPVELTKENLTGYFMHSDVPVIGTTKSSNKVFDKILFATNNSYLSNLFGYPTDCPQREKNGWTGDAHIASETGLYNFDGITVYEKWMADHRDEQQPNGVLPNIIPTSGWGYTWANGPDWTSTIAIIPWNIYLFYGDTQLLEKNYENIKRYVDHITEISPSGLTDWGLGDWVPVKSVTPKEFTSSVYYYTDALILSKTAKLFGKQDDQTKYAALAEKIKNAINTKYLNKSTGVYGTGLQTELSVPLFWGIVPDDVKAKVAENLSKRVIADNSHFDVGILGAKAVLNALSENGYADLAYTVATQETFPSYGWWIKHGATTLYENWPINAKSDISLNHIMFVEVCAWSYKGLGGIFPDPEKPGFKNVILKPNFVKGLDQFEARHAGPYGTIVSSWKKSGNKVSYVVTVPANSTATLYLKTKKISESGKELSKNENIQSENKSGNLRLQLKSGTYSFAIEN